LTKNARRENDGPSDHPNRGWGGDKNAGPENEGPSKSWRIKMQDFKIADQVAWHENGGPFACHAIWSVVFSPPISGLALPDHQTLT